MFIHKCMILYIYIYIYIHCIYIYIYIYVYIYIHMYIYKYIYVYIYDIYIYIYIYICIYINMYTYIYIYIYLNKDVFVFFNHILAFSVFARERYERKKNEVAFLPRKELRRQKMCFCPKIITKKKPFYTRRNMKMLQIRFCPAPKMFSNNSKCKIKNCWTFFVL